jgi:hypothetical protein
MIRHKLFANGFKWAMTVSNGCGFDPLNLEREADAWGQQVAHGAAPMQISDAVKLLTERWDQLDPGERSSLVEFLLSD